MHMKSTRSILRWLDKHILTLLTGILIVIIPLYPKLPLADLIEGYIVRLRAEDIFVLIAFVIWLIQLYRKKISLPRNKFSKFIFAYIIIGALSSLSAVFITRTVPLNRQHLFKLALHFARRIEYFSLFFIAYSGIRSRKDIKNFSIIALFTLLAVNIYGFGQKYMYWPAFSTMNREFSKGIRLYLTPHSRVMSTFAGHYDLAAYVMIALVILVPAIWLIKNKKLKWLLIALSLFTYWTLILTASRTSWLGFMAGITVIAVLLVRVKGFWWALKRWLGVSLLSIIIMFTLGDLSERYLQLLNSPHTIANIIGVEAGKVEEVIFKIKDIGYKIDDIKRGAYSPFKKEPPPNAIADTELSKVAAKSDAPPSPVKPTSLPPDVSREEDDLRQKISTESAVATASASVGGYSPNALKYGLSIAIRLDALWPRAIEGFKRNPLLGSGYSTLVKRENTEFTQAESTDNDYLRMLGETGLLGTITFLALPYILLSLAIKQYRNTKDNLSLILVLGTTGAVVGMLVSALYIDVFESSKVAYTFWLLSAIFIRSIELSKKRLK